MKISIMIATCKFTTLKTCIESILKNTDFERCDVEVIVSMNGCEPEARNYIESLGNRFRFIWVDKRIGAVKAFNLAAKVSDGEYLVKMDDDVQILNWGRNWLDLLVNPFLLDKDVGQTGAVIEPSWGNFKALVGFITMSSKKIWNELGGLDMAFNPGNGDDIDYSIRVQKAGYKIQQVPSLPAIHNGDGFIMAFPAAHISHAEYNYNGIEASELKKRNCRILYQRYGAPTHNVRLENFIMD